MKILIISGFLGAGKTTFIKHIAKNINMEFVVLENEYADVGIDKDFLNEKNLNVWEMSEGCICCSMTGDFKASIRNIYMQINPEYLLIEPTGVGMLSSIIKNIQAIEDCDITLLNPITMIDATCFDEYLFNFKDFFEDNILNTGKIILTKLNDCSSFDIRKIQEDILNINSNSKIISEDYRNLSQNFLEDIFNTNIENKEIQANFKIANHINLKTFSKTNFNIDSMDKLGLFLHKIVNGDFGKVYRAKGIVKIDGQWGKFNIVHKNFKMEACPQNDETKLVIIGNNLAVNDIENFLI